MNKYITYYLQNNGLYRVYNGHHYEDKHDINGFECNRFSLMKPYEGCYASLKDLYDNLPEWRQQLLDETKFDYFKTFTTNSFECSRRKAVGFKKENETYYQTHYT